MTICPLSALLVSPMVDQANSNDYCNRVEWSSHNCDAVFISVRFTGQLQTGLKEKRTRLRNLYQEIFQSRCTKWGTVFFPTFGRSAVVPVWDAGDVWNALLFHDASQEPMYSGRILILSLSMEGFTTNLQLFVTTYEELLPLDVWFGFFNGKKSLRFAMGQACRSNGEWLFCSLTLLVKMLLRQIEVQPVYRKQIILLFMIQMVKMRLVIFLELSVLINTDDY